MDVVIRTSQKVFDFIVQFKREHDGVAPTVQEIGKALGLSSKSVVWGHLLQLEMQGKIKRGRGSRMITVNGGAWTLQS